MKKFSKILSVALLVALVLSLGVASAFADETSQHTITITNTDQNVSHTYKAYQIFSGKLDAGQTKLSDIVWGSGVKGDELLADLKTAMTDFASCTSPAEVADVLATFSDTSALTESAGKLDQFGDIVAKHLSSTSFDFQEASGGKTYTATVTGDGYYFIDDVTTNLTGTTGSDTKSKHILTVVKDTTVYAKDTGLTPDKEIVEGSERVKTGTAAVGDTVKFEVKIKVPNTKKYIDHFIFDMVDKLPIGLTFTGITSVKVGEADVPYTLTVDGATYSAPTDPVDANAPAAGQTIKLVFTDFKAKAEAGNWIGQDMLITYTTVVNKKADFTSTGNINEVVFDYSNNPNYDYDGDQPTGDEPMGVTPKSTTKTLLINIELLKTGNGGQIAALAGAEFEITSADYNVTLVTGEKFEKNPYTPVEGEETAVAGTWYLLKDGSYTTTAPSATTTTSYASTEDTYTKISFQKSVVTPTGDTKKVTVISGEDGKIVLNGLKPGTYSIKETKAPSGYNLDPNTYTIKVNWDGTNKIFVKDENSSKGVTFDGNTATAKITIDNNQGAVLPSTGGIGTTIFYVVGGVLVLAAIILLVTKKRMSE